MSWQVALALSSPLALVLGQKLWSLISFLRLRRYLIEQVPEPEPEISLIQGHYTNDKNKVRAQFLSWVSSLPRVMRVHRTFTPSICFVHPDTITRAFADEPPKQRYVMDFFKEFIGEGLLTSHGKKWSRDRPLLEELFTSPMLRAYVTNYVTVSETMVGQLKQRCARGELVDAHDCFFRVLFDIYMRCGLGVTNDSWTDAESSAPALYMTASKFMSDATHERLGNFAVHNNFIFYLTAQGREFTRQLGIANGVADTIMTERRQAVKSGDGGFGYNMLDTMLKVRDEDDRGLSDGDIREHIATFLEAGHGIATAALQWMALYLRTYPEIQEKCRAEVQQVLAECGGLENLDADALSRLRYLTQFVYESLRYATVVPYIVRRLEKETTVDGYVLPAGTSVQILVYCLHYNPTVWEDPERFDPDRFSPEKSAERAPNSFLPFGIPLRNCIGRSHAVNQIKVVLTAILSNFRVLPADADEEEPVFPGGIIVAPDPTVQMKLEVLS